MFANRVWGPALSILLAAGAAFAADQVDRSQVRGDDEREQTLRQSLDHLHLANLEIEVRGRMATLGGTAESLFAKRQASTIARKIPGIEEVFNHLGVVEVSDVSAVERAIAEELRKDPHYTIYDEVEWTLDRGKVTLVGRLAPAGNPAAIEETVSKVRGVASIENDLRVLPYSTSDERLREAVAVALTDALGGERFAESGLHVVVEEGRVRLTGTVPDEDARKLAEKAARETEGAISVENRLTLPPKTVESDAA